jgi:hypothetical protein
MVSLDKPRPRPQPYNPNRNQVMVSLDKSAFLLRMLTHETSYKSAAADEKAIDR